MSAMEQTSGLPDQQRLFKRTSNAFEVNKALTTMGFSTWGALEPGKF